MSNTNDNGLKKISAFMVFLYALKGVPIRIKPLNISWQEIKTPRWPILFSFIGGLVYQVPSFIELILRDIREQRTITIENIFTSTIFAVIFSGGIILLFNLLTLFLFMLILKLFKSLSGKPACIVNGSQRVVYFACVFQPLLLLVPGLIMGDYFRMVTGNAGFINDICMYFVSFVVFIAGTARLLSVFQGMMQETNDNILAGLAGTVCCFDVWCIFIWLFSNYIHI